jgi:hypothetical protein
MVIILLFPSAKLAHRVGWEKETTPSWLRMPPLYRGELTSFSPQRGLPIGRGGERTQADISECVTPLSRGINNLFPLEGCP